MKISNYTISNYTDTQLYTIIYKHVCVYLYPVVSRYDIPIYGWCSHQVISPWKDSQSLILRVVTAEVCARRWKQSKWLLLGGSRAIPWVGLGESCGKNDGLTN